MERDPEISLDLLRSFLAVAETANFTRAAERLNCVQSAVSMQIRRLEESLQARLLERGSRHVRLTAEGEILVQFAKRIMRLKDQALEEIGQQSVIGRVRLGASDTSMCYLPRVLRRFAELYPRIDIDLSCTRSWEALDALDAGQVDLAFVTQRCGRKGGRLVSQSALVWAVAADSLVDEQDPVPLAIFGPGCIYRKTALAALEANGKAYRLAYESPSRAGLDCAVAAGLAVTLIPADCVDERLRVVPTTPGGLPALPDFKTYLFGASPTKPAATRAFAALLRESLTAR